MSRQGTMAHFEGTGPAGEHCQSCALFRAKDRRCTKAIEMTGRRVDPLQGYEQACKHFMFKPVRPRKEITVTAVRRTMPEIWDQTERRPYKPGRYDGEMSPDHARLFLAGAHGQLSPALAAQLKRAVRS